VVDSQPLLSIKTVNGDHRSPREVVVAPSGIFNRREARHASMHEIPTTLATMGHPKRTIALRKNNLSPLLMVQQSNISATNDEMQNTYGMFN